MLPLMVSWTLKNGSLPSLPIVAFTEKHLWRLVHNVPSHWETETRVAFAANLQGGLDQWKCLVALSREYPRVMFLVKAVGLGNETPLAPHFFLHDF